MDYSSFSIKAIDEIPNLKTVASLPPLNVEQEGENAVVSAEKMLMEAYMQTYVKKSFFRDKNSAFFTPISIEEAREKLVKTATNNGAEIQDIEPYLRAFEKQVCAKHVENIFHSQVKGEKSEALNLLERRDDSGVLLAQAQEYVSTNMGNPTFWETAFDRVKQRMETGIDQLQIAPKENEADVNLEAGNAGVDVNASDQNKLADDAPPPTRGKKEVIQMTEKLKEQGKGAVLSRDEEE